MMRICAVCAIGLLASVVSVAEELPYRIGVVQGYFPGEDPALVEALKQGLAQDSAIGPDVAVSSIAANDLCDPAKLDPKFYDLIVLTNAAQLPAASVAPITAYLKAGGDIIALNAPLWQTLLIKPDKEWVSRTQYETQMAGQPPDHALVAFNPDDIAQWQRQSNTIENAATYETVDGGPAAGQRALHAKVSNMQGWDNFGPAQVDASFLEGHTLTVFSAKGGAGTPSLSVEWIEKDGSRWIAVVALSTEWRRYVLAPGDFKYWESVPARSGGVFNPQNAMRFDIGLAFTHTGMVGGAHEYWVGPFGTAQATPELEKLFAAPAVPAFEALSPGYKFFDSHDVALLLVCGSELMVGPPEGVVRSIQPRPDGAGFDKGRDWRWLPILEANDKERQWRGNPAAMMIHVGGPYKGGQWASFGIESMAWYKLNLFILKGVAAMMYRGVYIVDSGSQYYTYFPEQSMKLGMRVVNVSRFAQKGMTARITVFDEKSVKYCHTEEWPIDLEPGQEKTVSVDYPDWPRNKMRVVAQLMKDNVPIDEVSHEANVWEPKKDKAFVETKDGQFMDGDRRWRAHGVNYMPSSGIGTEDGPYFEQWLGARAYDPEIIERDLGHCRDLGLNSVSIFLYYANMKDQNLLDLLRRLDAHGMKANLSLRPGTGFEFPWEQFREMIEYYRLPENDTLFAYDIDWEPLFLKHKDRMRWDPAWEAWIVERYGSIENAEKDWACPVPRDAAGKVTNPDKKQLESDGDWRRMSCAYRRCMDTILYKYYSAARALIRGIDPNHFVSFRMTEAGDPTMRWDDVMPFDFPYLAAAVDILEPEGYGRIGDWEKVKPGWFEFEYARWAAPKMPMMWAEAGVSAWDVGAGRASEKLLEFQGQYFRDFYRMMSSSGATGIFWWWYPGGFRTGENSDYGIINCDGSERPNSKAIRENAASFLGNLNPKPIDTWIEIDRDARADGICGIYDTHKDTFWKAIDESKTPGFKTAGTGTNSGNCPLLAVGNTACNGTNPPKYLDGFFDSVEVKDPTGAWVKVESGGTVRAASGKPVVARVQVTNLGEAEWIASGPGAVSIAINGKKTPIPAAVKHLDSLQIPELVLADASGEVVLSFDAEGRTPFGPKFRVKVVAE